MFSKKRCRYFVHKDLICVVPRFLRRQTIAARIGGFWMFRPWSIRAVGRGRGDVNLSLLRLSQVAKRGYVFGQVGGNGCQPGAVDTFSRFLRGHTPATCCQKGGSFRPSSAAVPLGRRTYSIKKTLCVLGMGCGRLASASEFHFEAGWGTWERLPCARFAHTRKWPKKQGGYPPLTISHIIIAAVCL